MVDYQTKIRSKLQSKIFDQIGKTVTFKKKESPIYNSRGDLEDWTETSSSTSVVPYNIISDNRTHQEFGDLLEGEMDMAVSYDTNIEVDDILTIDEVDWKVKQVEKNYLPDNVVTIIRLTKN